MKRAKLLFLVGCLAAVIAVASVVVPGAAMARPDPAAAPQSAAAAAGASLTAAADDEFHLYWGDIHTHTAFSNDAWEIGTRTFSAGDLEYARDVAHLDFTVITDHAEWVNREEWQLIQADSNAAYVPGTFVPLLGFEYTNSADAAGSGHKCVIFRDAVVPADPIGYGPRVSDPEELWDRLAGYQYMTIPHHPAKGYTNGINANMSTDWDYVNAENQQLVEIYSGHGSSEAAGAEEPVDNFIADRSVEAALQRWLTTHNPGYKLGIISSTDNHLARPGSVEEDPANLAPGLEGNYTGGLVAVSASTKTREAIFDALQAKRAYATSGPRIGLSFTAEFDRITYPMGSTLSPNHEPGPVQLHVSAQGDGAAIQKIQIIKNGTVVKEVDGAQAEFTDFPGDWSYYRVKVWQEPTLRNDGVLAPERAWSSPIWVETAQPFTDVPANHPYHEAIGTIHQAGIADGYASDGGWVYHPDSPLYRAQLAKMIDITLGMLVTEDMVPPFTDLGSDVPDNLYPHEYVAAAYAAAITQGTGGTNFSPYTNVTRAQTITMVVRGAQSLYPDALQTPPAGYEATFGDWSQIHGPNLAIAEYNGLLEGLVGFGATWDPAASATRGEIAQILANLLPMLSE